MTNEINLDGEIFNLIITRKTKIKHIYLRIIKPYEIEVRTNIWIDKNYINDFIQKKSSWILKHHNEKKDNKISIDDMYFLGNIHKKEELLDSEDIEEFYKRKAKEFITPIVKKYSIIMNLYPTQLKFRKNKSRWGSCSFKNNINLNTELIKKDIRFIEYVVVHELAHIKYKNHQKEFWNLVEKYIPDYKIKRKL